MHVQVQNINDLYISTAKQYFKHWPSTLKGEEKMRMVQKYLIVLALSPHIEMTSNFLVPYQTLVIAFIQDLFLLQTFQVQPFL